MLFAGMAFQGNLRNNRFIRPEQPTRPLSRSTASLLAEQTAMASTTSMSMDRTLAPSTNLPDARFALFRHMLTSAARRKLFRSSTRRPKSSMTGRTIFRTRSKTDLSRRSTGFAGREKRAVGHHDASGIADRNGRNLCCDVHHAHTAGRQVGIGSDDSGDYQCRICHGLCGGISSSGKSGGVHGWRIKQRGRLHRGFRVLARFSDLTGSRRLWRRITILAVPMRRLNP